MDIAHRVAVHRALADEHRIQIVDALWLSDRTPTELQETTGLPSNHLAFHLDTLEDAGLIERHASQGDGRRRYVSLLPDALDAITTAPPSQPGAAGLVLFVCTHNSARSQLAAAAWSTHGGTGLSAGWEPAPHVHPLAVRVGREHGLDLSEARPQGYDAVTVDPDLVVSVCDRAREAAPPFHAPLLHWSVRDPADGARLEDFEDAFHQIERRIRRLLTQAAA